MLLLTLRDLQYRAMRFAIVILGTTVVFALLLLVNGISEHFAREPQYTVDAIGADAWIVPEGVSGPFTSSATVDPSLVDGVTGAMGADPAIVARSTMWLGDVPQEVVVIGHVPGGIGAPPVSAGSGVDAREQLVVESTGGVEPGARVRVASAEFTVVGISENTTVLAGVPLVFMSIDDAREHLFDGADVATAFLSRGVPSSVPPGLKVIDNETVVEDARRPLERATSSLDLIQILLWIVSAMIIGGVVYLSSMERRRDFAVLKAVGGSTRALLSGLVGQSVVIALAAAGLASVLQLLIAPSFPIRVEVSSRALIQLPVIALVVALVASVAGMRRVARTDPADAFSGPGG